MSARFRIITSDGGELGLADVEAVVRALRDGVVRPDSMLFDSHYERWQPAGQHDAVQAAVAAMRDNSATPHPPPPDVQPIRPPHEGPLPHAIQPPGTNAVLERLRAYIGPNWESHYQSTFSRLLEARTKNASPGWCWNWCAALLPLWFLYRRLYLAFFGFLALYLLIDALDKIAAGSLEGGSPIALLFLGQIVLAGFVGDRLLFNKAYATVTAPRAPEDPQGLEVLGRPHRWALWAPLVIIIVGILAAIVIPQMAQ